MRTEEMMEGLRAGRKVARVGWQGFHLKYVIPITIDAVVEDHPAHRRVDSVAGDMFPWLELQFNDSDKFKDVFTIGGEDLLASDWVFLD